MPFSKELFDPNTLTLLTRAYNAAWEDLQKMNADAASEKNERATRAELARRIIAAEANGEHNPERLKLLALKAFDNTIQVK